MDPIVDEDNFDHDGDGRWPFHSFVEQLLLDMFDPGKVFLVYFCLSLHWFPHQMIFSLVYCQCGRFAMVVSWL